MTTFPWIILLLSSVHPQQQVDGASVTAADKHTWGIHQSHRFVYVNSDGSFNDPADANNHNSFPDQHQEEPVFKVEQEEDDDERCELEEPDPHGLNGV